MNYKKQLMLVLVDSELPIFTKNVCQKGLRGDMAIFDVNNKIDEWYSCILEPFKKEAISRYVFELEKNYEKTK